MNNSKEHLIQLKLEYLYDKLENIVDQYSSSQMDFILQEIDYYKTELLKLETEQFYRGLDWRRNNERFNASRKQDDGRTDEKVSYHFQTIYR